MSVDRYLTLSDVAERKLRAYIDMETHSIDPRVCGRAELQRQYRIALIPIGCRYLRKALYKEVQRYL